MPDITTPEGRKALRRLCADLEFSWTAPDGKKGDIWFCDHRGGSAAFVTVPARVIRLVDAMFDKNRALDGLDIAQEMMRAVWVIDHLLGFGPAWNTETVLPRDWNHWLRVAFRARDGALAKWDKWRKGDKK